MNGENATTTEGTVELQDDCRSRSSNCSPPPRRGRYSPLDPVVLSTDRAAPNQQPHKGDLFGGGTSVSAIVGDNAALMENVAKLWIVESDRVVDVTFGRGVFWRRLPGLPHVGHDIAGDGVDCRETPHDSGSVDVVAFDPPYRPTHGSAMDESNGLAQAYQLGGLETMNDVLDLYEAGICEAARILRPGGRLLCKCQDMSYGHRLHLVSLDVLRLMLQSGFDFADQFVLVNGTRLASPQWEKQERARRAHSVMWVGWRL